jgi:hypothetical protein
MSVTSVNANILSLLSASAPLLRLQNDGTLRQTLQLGQVIEAKVMRSFQGGRFLVQLGAQERVVDSSIPLQEGQVLRARVLALDEQVVLERMQAQTQTEAEPGAGAAPAWLQREGAQQALALYSQYASLLDAAQWAGLQGLARAQGASATVLAALTLARLNLPLQERWTQAASCVPVRRCLRPSSTPAAWRRTVPSPTVLVLVRVRVRVRKATPQAVIPRTLLAQAA